MKTFDWSLKISIGFPTSESQPNERAKSRSRSLSNAFCHADLGFTGCLTLYQTNWSETSWTNQEKGYVIF